MSAVEVRHPSRRRAIALRREQLITAQVAILRNQDAERAAGITVETDRYLALHRTYYAIADSLPWWAHLGVFTTARHRHLRDQRAVPRFLS